MRLNSGENQGNKAGYKNIFQFFIRSSNSIRCPVVTVTFSKMHKKLKHCKYLGPHAMDIFDPYNQHIKANLTKNQLQQSKRLKNDFQIVLPNVVIPAKMQLKLLTPLSQFTILFKHWIRLWAILILNTHYCFNLYTENNDFSFILFIFHCIFQNSHLWVWKSVCGGRHCRLGEH